MSPALSVVVLTWNEAGNIGPALRALARQHERDFEVIVIDAASTDGTVAVIEAERLNLGVPLRLVVAETCIPIGEARNRGVALAQAPNVAFLSADAEVDDGWTAAALHALANADMAFARQVHAPHHWTVGACVRGLRYHFPHQADDDAMRYASNVAAAYKRPLLVQFPFDPWANAAEDLLLAKRAAAAGYRAVYVPAMVVHHHDVASAGVEWRKNVREGYGWALYAREIGHLNSLLIWGALLALALGLAVLAPVAGLLVFAVALWLPALRRAWRRRKVMPRWAIAKGVLFSPAFDLAFLLQYLRGLAAPRKATAAHATTVNVAAQEPETQA